MSPLRTARLWIVPGLLGALGIAFAVRPRAGDVSAVENRPLAAPPRCDAAARWFDGSCAREIDLYVADHFPGREHFVTAAIWMKAHRGVPAAEEAPRVVEVRSLDEGWLERLEDWAPLGGGVAGPDPATTGPCPDAGTDWDGGCAPDCPDRPTSPGGERCGEASGAPCHAGVLACEPGPAHADAPSLLFSLGAPPAPRPACEAPEVPVRGDEPTPASVAVNADAPSPVAAPPAPSTPPPTALAGETRPAAAPDFPPAAAAPRPVGKPTRVEISNGILITGTRAMQLFGGTEQSARAYAQVINTYAERLAGKVKVHSVVVPSAVSFHLPAEQAHKSRSERENLATLASALRLDVSNPDTFPALQAHALDEPLFLRTDHHWNGLGAYRAYEAFCRTAGFPPVALSAFRHGQKTGFVGSYGAFTQDPALRSAPDVVDHYDPPVTYSATRFLDAAGGGTGHPARFVDPQLRGYLVFLGGDAPLMHAKTDVKNGRRAVFVKNSFGNAFAPLLLSHFEELYVVDYRYYAGSLDALVQNSGATDLIFFNVTLLANAAPHRQRLAALGRGSKAWVQPSSARPDAGTPADAGEAVAPGEPPASEDGDGGQ